MKFLVYARLPASLCHFLRAFGHDAIHTSELPDGNRTSDSIIDDFSVLHNHVVVSKDCDFYFSHLLARRPHKLRLVRTDNIGVGELKELFQRRLSEIVSALESNTLVELNRRHVQRIT